MSEGYGPAQPAPEGDPRVRLSHLERRMAEMERTMAGLKAVVGGGADEATPIRDPDSLEVLTGNVAFKKSGSLADVTVDIPPTGQNEAPGSDFQLWGQAQDRDWEMLANPANRPLRLHGHEIYRNDKTYKVKATFDCGGPNTRSDAKVARKDKTKTLRLT